MGQEWTVFQFVALTGFVIGCPRNIVNGQGENVLFQTYSSRQWLRGLKLFCSRQHFSSHSVPDNSFPDKIIMSLCSRHQAYHGLSQKYCPRYLFSRQLLKVGILPDNKIKAKFDQNSINLSQRSLHGMMLIQKLLSKIKPNRHL